MQRIETILKKIKDGNLNISEISRITGIPNTRIYKWLELKGKPKTEDAEKLLNWANEYLEQVPREKAQESQPDQTLLAIGKIDYERKYIAQVEQTISFLQGLVNGDIGKIKISLETALGNQDAGLVWIEELLRRDIKRSAKGNPKKEEQDLREIQKRTGVQLGLKPKDGIGTDAGKEHK